MPRSCWTNAVEAEPPSPEGTQIREPRCRPNQHHTNTCTRPRHAPQRRRASLQRGRSRGAKVHCTSGSTAPPPAPGKVRSAAPKGRQPGQSPRSSTPLTQTPTARWQRNRGNLIPLDITATTTALLPDNLHLTLQALFTLPGRRSMVPTSSRRRSRRRRRGPTNSPAGNGWNDGGSLSPSSNASLHGAAS